MAQRLCQVRPAFVTCIQSTTVRAVAVLACCLPKFYHTRTTAMMLEYWRASSKQAPWM